MFEISFFGASFAGLLSFFSPCVLPLVPFYLSYLAGVTVQQAAQGELPASFRKKILISALCFAAGVLSIFVLLGASATLFGQLFRTHFDLLRQIAAGVIIVMGLHFLGFFRIIFLTLSFQRRTKSPASSPLGAYSLGLAFAFGWTPCVGPILATILFIAASGNSAAVGVGLLAAYGVGMTLPFVIAALFTKTFIAATTRFRPHLGKVEKFIGVTLILLGLLIATDSLSRVARWLLNAMPWFATIG